MTTIFENFEFVGVFPEFNDKYSENTNDIWFWRSVPHGHTIWRWLVYILKCQFMRKNYSKTVKLV